MLESKKAFEVLDDSTYIVASRGGDSSRSSSKANGEHRGDLGQPFLWRATSDKPIIQKSSVPGQWPLGADSIQSEFNTK
jgi:hypothetical protein